MKRNVVGLVLIASIVLGISGHAFYTNGTAPILYENAEAYVEEKEKVVLYRVETEEEMITRRIRETFPEEPRMVRIATCESELNPVAKNPHSSASGLFQIMVSVHERMLREHRLNVWDVEDNLRAARILYDESGLKPWLASVGCWSK